MEGSIRGRRVSFEKAPTLAESSQWNAALAFKGVQAMVAALRGELLVRVSNLEKEGARFEVIEVDPNVPLLENNVPVRVGLSNVRLLGGGVSQRRVLENLHTGRSPLGFAGRSDGEWMVDFYEPRPISARTYCEIGPDLKLDRKGTSSWVFPPWTSSGVDARGLLSGVYFGQTGRVYRIDPRGKKSEWLPGMGRVDSLQGVSLASSSEIRGLDPTAFNVAGIKHHLRAPRYALRVDVRPKR